MIERILTYIGHEGRLKVGVRVIVYEGRNYERYLTTDLSTGWSEDARHKAIFREEAEDGHWAQSEDLWTS